MKRSRLPSGISIDQRLNHLPCSNAAAKHRQAIDAQQRIDERLRGKRSDPSLGVRAQGAHRKEAGGDSHSEGTGSGVACNN